MRASNSSVAPRVRARESATAPAGSAAISRAAFKPSVSTSSGATTMLAMPNSLACVALSGCPMTRNSNARRWPIRRGASRLEAASGIRPRLTNGVEKYASEPDHKIAVEQHGGADADRDPAHGRDYRLVAANERGQETQCRAIEAACAFRGLEKVRQIVAGRERPRHARDQHAMNGIIRVRALDTPGSSAGRHAQGFPFGVAALNTAFRRKRS